MAGEALSNGSKIEVNVGSEQSPSWKELGGIQSIRIPSPERDEIDVTALDSEGEETIPGLARYGETSFTLFLRGTGTSTLADNQSELETLAESEDVKQFRITPPAALTSTITTCAGWVKSFVPTLATGEAVQADVTIRWTGKPTRS